MKSNTTLGIVIGFGTAFAASNAYFAHVISDSATSIRETQGEIRELKKEVNELREVVTYVTKTRLNLSQKEEDCLVQNVFHEAGVESHTGKLAVAQVTMNRLKSGNWGSNLCQVVFAKSQFSWTSNKKKRSSKPKGPLWEASVKAVHDFERGWRIRHLENSHFYHTDYIQRPKWADPKYKVHKIGQHIFYSTSKKT